MKIRLSETALRVRITAVEQEKIMRGEPVQLSWDIGSSPLSIEIILSDRNEGELVMKHNHVSLLLPDQATSLWHSNPRTPIVFKSLLSSKQTLDIEIELDLRERVPS